MLVFNKGNKDIKFRSDRNAEQQIQLDSKTKADMRRVSVTDTDKFNERIKKRHESMITKLGDGIDQVVSNTVGNKDSVTTAGHRAILI